MVSITNGAQGFARGPSHAQRALRCNSEAARAAFRQSFTSASASSATLQYCGRQLRTRATALAPAIVTQ
eukprot:12441173-Alexandrium_andersonii.AAC.1